MAEYVTLYVNVRPEQALQAAALLNVHPSCIYHQEPPKETQLEMEAKYGSFKEESALLTNAGIAHTWHHDGGAGFEQGYGFVVFTEGGNIRSNTYVRIERFIPPKLLDLWLKSNHIEHIRRKMQEYLNDHSLPTLTPDMIQWGKQYKLKQIVKA